LQHGCKGKIYIIKAKLDIKPVQKSTYQLQEKL
jgi:hypothetical protein